MAILTQYQTDISNATWIDVNSRFTIDANPDRLPDVQAINNSLFNLLNCAIGARGRIFQPEYGTLLYQFLQEPLDNSTARKMRTSFLQAIARWEPRITVDQGNSYVRVNEQLPGYEVRIAYSLNLDAKPAAIAFNIVKTTG
jgi:phage baseplate assembly protein W